MTWGHDEIALVLIDKMVDASGNISLPGQNNRTLLHDAAKGSDDAVFRSLLETGADISVVDIDGRTALDIALERPDSENIVDILLERSTHASIADYSITRIFDDALRAGDTDHAQILLQKCPPPWSQAHINSLLWKAAAQSPSYEHRQFKLLMDLAQSGTSALHFTDEGGWSALHHLCSAKPANSASAREMIQLLISEGMRLDGRNHTGLTPLHHAIYTKNLVPIQLLLRGYCSRLGRGSVPDFIPAIDHLMKLDVSVSTLVMDYNGYTPIDRAAMELEDEQVRGVFGILLGWPCVK
ncbi:ankyrin repeat-containing domain protein [Aspergillus insuetus]